MNAISPGAQGKGSVGQKPAARTGRPLAAFFGVAVVVAPLTLMGWLLWRSIFLPRALVRELVAVAASGDAAGVRARIVPDRRAQTTDAQINEWIAGLRGYDDLEWGRKSSLGTTRGGRSTGTMSGYVHYPGTPEERSFSSSYIDYEGEWYIDSFSLGPRVVPR